jgi:GT2 family glycosyltransferase
MEVPMTLLNDSDFRTVRRCHTRAPACIDFNNVSVIVPVKDNQTGVDRLCAEAWRALAHTPPREVIIVDNNSAVPTRVPTCRRGRPFRVRRLDCPTPGPAAARNAGASAATGKWLLFTDSDCVPTKTLLSGYARRADGSIAYAGHVRCTGTGWLVNYYNSQQTFLPPRAGGYASAGDDDERPASLVTANCLVWRTAFERLGGFDEGFPEAAGEDVDLGIRLWQIGELGYAPGSVVLHEVGGGYAAFASRFQRYGRGNGLLECRHPGYVGRPNSFCPRDPRPAFRALARLQFTHMARGYASLETSPPPRPRSDPSRASAA